MHSLPHVALMTNALCMETSPMIAGSYPGLGKEGAIFLLTFGHGGIHKNVPVLSGRMNRTPTQYSFIDIIPHYKQFFPFLNRSSLQSLVPVPMNKTTIRVLSSICNCNFHLLKYSRDSFAFALRLLLNFSWGPGKDSALYVSQMPKLFYSVLAKDTPGRRSSWFWFGGGTAGQPGL